MSINSLTSYNPLTINGLDTLNIGGDPFDPNNYVNKTSYTDQTILSKLTVPSFNINGATASKIPIFDASKNLVSSGVDAVKITFLDNVSSDIQGQLNNKLDLTTASTQNVNSAVNISGALASTTSLSAPRIDLTNTWKMTSATSSPYDLTLNNLQTGNNVIFRDTGKVEASGFLNTGATSLRVAVFDVNKNIASSSINTTELSYLSGASSNLQTQINSKGGLTQANYWTNQNIFSWETKFYNWLQSFSSVSLGGDTVFTSENLETYGAYSFTAIAPATITNSGIEYSLNPNGNSPFSMRLTSYFFTDISKTYVAMFRIKCPDPQCYLTVKQNGVNIQIGAQSIVYPVSLYLTTSYAYLFVPFRPNTINSNATTNPIYFTFTEYSSTTFDQFTLVSLNTSIRANSLAVVGNVNSSLNMGSNYVYMNSAPTMNTQATNKQYVDGAISSSVSNLLASNNTWTGTNTYSNLSYFNDIVRVSRSGVSNRKIVLYDGGVDNDHNFYGFGINNGVLRYQINTTSDNHIWYTGTSSTTSNELMRLKGSGTLGIGVSDPSNDNKLQVAGRALFGYVNTTKKGIFIDNENSYGDNPCIQGVSSSFSTNDIAINPAGGKVAIGRTTASTALQLWNGVCNIHGGGGEWGVVYTTQPGSLVIGDVSKDYGGNTNGTTSANLAGLLMECLDKTEIAVHDSGARISSLLYYYNNVITMGRDMGGGWGITPVSIAGALTVGNSLTVSPNINISGQGFYVGGVITSYYPIVIDSSPSWETAGKFYFGINRGSVHLDAGSKGALTAWFEGHNTNWGNGVDFFSYNIVNNSSTWSYTRFIAGAVQDSRTTKIVVWVRGATTYYFTGIGAYLSDGNSSGSSITIVPAVGVAGTVYNSQTTINAGFDYNTIQYNSLIGFTILNNNVSLGGSIAIGLYGEYKEGCIYSDDNWGMLFRAKKASPVSGDFIWVDSVGNERMRIYPTGYVGIATATGAFTALSRFTIKSNYSGGENEGFCLNASDGNVYNWRLYSFVQAGSQVGYKMRVNNISSVVDCITFAHNGHISIGSGTPTYSSVLEVVNASADYTNSFTIKTAWPSIKLDGTGTTGRVWTLLNGGSGADIGQGNLGIYDATRGAYVCSWDATGSFGVGNISGNILPKMLIVDGNTGSWNTAGWQADQGLMLSSLNNPTATSQALTIAFTNGNVGWISCLAPSVSWLDLYIAGATVWFASFGAVVAYTVYYGIYNVSDEREKEDIQPLKTESSLKRILQARPVHYRRKHYDSDDKTPAPEEMKQKRCIGFVAQEVQESNPHCVSEWENKDVEKTEEDNGMRLGICYNDYVIHLVGAVQEQQKQINLLVEHSRQKEDELTQLRKEFDEYRRLTEERFDKLASLVLGK